MKNLSNTRKSLIQLLMLFCLGVAGIDQALSQSRAGEWIRVDTVSTQSLPLFVQLSTGTTLTILRIGQYDSLKYGTVLSESLARDNFGLRTSLIESRYFRDKYKGLYEASENRYLEIRDESLSLRGDLVNCGEDLSEAKGRLEQSKIENWVWRGLAVLTAIVIVTR